MTRLERLAIAKMLEDASHWVNPYDLHQRDAAMHTYAEGYRAACAVFRDRLEWIVKAKAEDLKKYIR